MSSHGYMMRGKRDRNKFIFCNFYTMSGVRVMQGPKTYNVQECIMANSAHLDPDDFVIINSSGFLNKPAAGDKIQGFFMGAATDATADNQTVGLVKVKYCPVDQNTVFELTADQACTQTDLGAYADIIVSTNAITCNLAAGSSGQLEVIDFDPNRDGTTTLVRCVIAEPEALAFAQA